MPNKMLIDASHPEETRVVVVRGNRIEEFDFESQDKKQLKGNIYLARVTRVEPSLQAAFVEYGGNRHGFLAFSEIHPDYYQIPVADRQALLRADEEAAMAEDEDEDEERGRGRRRRGKGRGRGRDGGKAAGGEAAADEASAAGEASADDGADREAQAFEARSEDEPEADAGAGTASGDDGDEDQRSEAMAQRASGDAVSEDVSEDGDENGDDANGHSEVTEVESVGADDAVEEVQRVRRAPRRQYKIQEVIKRRQILLVQVVKEERGNKGAALTTYLSLAGRYSVLMPNTARGGGISRKITNAQDRKRLKDVVKDLDVPKGMGVILRTAGESRTKAEIKRDYEYLMRLWENVRTLTLQSTAPALVYEEGSLIKRSVRDLYNKDIDDIQVAGDEGYREAKDFMRMLMPSHAKVVQPYRDPVPLFVRYGVESQLDRMLQPQVTLKSGGYIIINQTEALVSIDVNSGRSTREHSIEDTALQTNLEAAEEVARQLRLRDLAGLIVIDFIDMEENRNNRAVEKKLKDCLKNDRARIQVGRISHFGLLEMSRQRIRASVLESTMQPCPHCGGTGHVRSDSSVALLVLRAVEEFLIKENRYHLTVKTPFATALYVLNHKRRNLAELEAKFGLSITVEADETIGSQHYAIFKGALVDRSVISPAPMIEAPAFDIEDDEIDESLAEAEEDEAGEETAQARPNGEDGREGRHERRRRRRRRRRGGRDREGRAEGDVSEGADAAAIATGADGEAVADDEADADEVEGEGGDEAVSAADDSEERAGKRRRRGKRGGRRNRRDDEQADAAAGSGDDDSGPEPEAAEAAAPQDDAAAEAPVLVSEAPATEAEAPAEEPAKPARRSRKKVVAAEGDAPAAEAPKAEKPARARRKAAPKAEEAAPAAAVAEPAEAVEELRAVDAPIEVAQHEPEIVAEPAAEKPLPPKEPVVTSSGAAEAPRKGGWWQRKGFF